MSLIPFSDEVKKGSSLSSKREDQALVELSLNKDLDLDKVIEEFVNFISSDTSDNNKPVIPGPLADNGIDNQLGDSEVPSSGPVLDADGIPNLLTDSCGIAYDVRKFVPFWMKVEDRNEKTLFVKFLQYYYNWLYCDKNAGAKYRVDTIERIQDIEFMDQTTAQHFINTFVDGLVNLNLVDVNSTKRLIKNIKDKLYGRKTTPEAISRFFTTIFDKVNGVQVQEPKTEMMRLNLGNIATNTGSSGGFFGSEASENALLNYGRMTDRFFNDFTYTVNLLTEQAEDIPVLADYEVSYNNILHPIGTRVFFQTTIDDYNPAVVGSTFDGLDPRFFENPQIGNYVVFSMENIIGFDAIAGCSGSPSSDAISGNTYNMPSFVHPNWASGVSGETPIGDLKVFDMLFLPLNIDGVTNPNLGITSCDNLCAADGNCT